MSTQFKLADSGLEKGYDKIVEYYIRQILANDQMRIDHALKELKVADDYLAKEGEM